MPTALVTGSSGLVGSACVRHFHALGWSVHGLDDNSRRDYFGRDGDTSRNRERLLDDCPGFAHHHGDIRDWLDLRLAFNHVPDLIIHCAGQPSHDWAASRPFEDFEANALGTLNLLEATRQFAADAAFCFLSTNKVYGSAPNHAPWLEDETRYVHARPDWRGFGEETRIDQSTHSLFGCSKLAADLYVQEYGRYFGLKTACFRAGCLTGGAHAGAEQHGFLAYLARCVKEGRPYVVHGHKGKQVRDQLHAADVALACELYYREPRPGEVYNLGGGKENSVSVLEAIDAMQQAVGKRLAWRYKDEPRKGDHICYYSDTSKLRSHYPGWSVTRPLDAIISELAKGDLRCP